MLHFNKIARYKNEIKINNLRNQREELPHIARKIPYDTTNIVHEDKLQHK